MNEQQEQDEKTQEQAPAYTEPSLPEDEHAHESEDEAGIHDPEKHKVHQKNLEDFLTRFQTENQAEDKLRLAITFMRNSLSQPGTPYFKGFWEARQLCPPIFKENLAPQTRADLWNEYRDLCNESHRLKQLLEEQSAFAVEQIDLAIQALENDVGGFDEKLAAIAAIDFPAPSKVLEDHLEEYQQIQKELQLLNAHASRINALRKELIRTEMRIRQKNKFFRRLSTIGDKVFPRRKELIKKVSTLFLEDVDAFVANHFGQDSLRHPLFFYRDEIKALQSIAKVLTLNTHAFTHTRSQLSECWDHVKEIEKERKKVRAEQKAVYQQNVNEVLEQIDALRIGFEEGSLGIPEAHQAVDEIYNTMNRVELGKDEKRFLRDKLAEARAPLVAKLREEEQLRSEKEQAAEREKKEKVRSIKEAIQNLFDHSEGLTAEEMSAKRDHLLSEIQTSPLTKIEKQSLERGLKPLKDLIAEKKERAVLSLSEKDQETLEQLRQILRQRKERRKEIKSQLEELRKAAGSSGLSFEKAMAYNEQVQAERERLEKIDAAIVEIEEKIAELEG